MIGWSQVRERVTGVANCPDWHLDMTKIYQTSAQNVQKRAEHCLLVFDSVEQWTFLKEVRVITSGLFQNQFCWNLSFLLLGLFPEKHHSKHMTRHLWTVACSMPKTHCAIMDSYTKYHSMAKCYQAFYWKRLLAYLRPNHIFESIWSPFIEYVICQRIIKSVNSCCGCCTFQDCKH